MKKRTFLSSGLLCIVLFSFLALSGAAWGKLLPVNLDEPLPGDPSGEGIYPVVLNGNPTCKDIDCEYYEDSIKFKPKDSSGMGIVVDVKQRPGDDYYFDWTSTVPVFCVLAKGGNWANVYYYGEDGAYGDTGLHAPLNLNGKGNPYGLSHEILCYGKTPVPEAATMALLGVGLIALAGFGRKLFR